MSVFTDALRRPPDDRRPRHHLARDRRQRVRAGVGRRRHAPPGVGLAGRHRRQRPAVHGLPRSPPPRPTTAAAALRPGRRARCSSSSCRSTAGGAGGRTAAAAPAHPRWCRAGPRRASGRRTSSAGWPPSWSATSSSARSAPGFPAPTGGTTWPTRGSSSARSLATYAMARGWVDFWLCWIAVDLVGVPELLHFHFYPSAVLYGDLRRAS